jgi:arginine repressor
MTQLKRYIVERDIPSIGSMSLTELCGAARASNQAIDQIGADLQWVHSYVAGDKTYCVYLAKDEATINKHAELSGIPVSGITEVPQVIDPLTANN